MGNPSFHHNRPLPIPTHLSIVTRWKTHTNSSRAQLIVAINLAEYTVAEVLGAIGAVGSLWLSLSSLRLSYSSSLHASVPAVVARPVASRSTALDGQVMLDLPLAGSSSITANKPHLPTTTSRLVVTTVNHKAVRHRAI